MKLARIFIAASSGTNGQSASVACSSSAAPLARFTSKPMSVISSRRMVTSLIFGTLWRTQRSSVRTAAAIILRTAFLAPAMRTSPDSGTPPVITNFCMDRCSLVADAPVRSGRIRFLPLVPAGVVAVAQAEPAAHVP